MFLCTQTCSLDFFRIQVISKTSDPVVMQVFCGMQGYRVKRISACGGCLGDYRR
jgi:hypothetical protein